MHNALIPRESCQLTLMLHRTLVDWGHGRAWAWCADLRSSWDTQIWDNIPVVLWVLYRGKKAAKCALLKRIHFVVIHIPISLSQVRTCVVSLVIFACHHQPPLFLVVVIANRVFFDVHQLDVMSVEAIKYVPLVGVGIDWCWLDQLGPNCKTTERHDGFDLPIFGSLFWEFNQLWRCETGASVSTINCGINLVRRFCMELLYDS